MNVLHKMMAVLWLGVFAVSAWAQERATPDEAKAMVEKAVAHIKSVGAEKAYADFNAGGKWVDRDLYIFVYDFKGINLAWGGKPTMVGKDLSGIKDADGKPLFKDLMAAAVKGGGWHNYLWSDPLTKKALPKSSYVMRVPGAEAFVGAGAYKQ